MWSIPMLNVHLRASSLHSECRAIPFGYAIPGMREGHSLSRIPLSYDKIPLQSEYVPLVRELQGIRYVHLISLSKTHFLKIPPISQKFHLCSFSHRAPLPLSWMPDPRDPDPELTIYDGHIRDHERGEKFPHPPSRGFATAALASNEDEVDAEDAACGDEETAAEEEDEEEFFEGGKLGVVEQLWILGREGMG